MSAQLKVAIACGGTGGHVIPGLATADALTRRGHEVTLWLTGRMEERAALKDWSGPVVMARVRGFSSILSVRGARALFGMLPVLFNCVKTMKRCRPDILLAMGSHASVGPALAAKLLGIPLVLHEANAIPGRAIRFLSPFADAVAVGFDETREILRHKRVVLTGMPIRKGARGECEPEFLSDLAKDAFTILVMGGSRGAHALNMLAASAIARLRAEGCAVQVIHLTGFEDEAVVRDMYQSNGVPNAVFGFLNAMDRAYGPAAFVVCRAGASTCAELLHYALPALLVPYPYATGRHQTANARALEKTGLAEVREEKDIDVQWLVEYLRRRVNDAAGLESIRSSARERFSGDAAEALADLVQERAGVPVVVPITR